MLTFLIVAMTTTSRSVSTIPYELRPGDHRDATDGYRLFDRRSIRHRLCGLEVACSTHLSDSIVALWRRPGHGIQGSI